MARNNPKSRFLLLILLLILAGATAMAKEPTQPPGKRTAKRTSQMCSPASSSVELDINNVRALLHNGGDMWWDLTNSPRYEVPKVDNPAERRHSSFAASLWIGGIDNTNNLRVAAATYRQNGNDFFPGPLDDFGNVTEYTCDTWDRHFKITKAKLDAFRADFASDGQVDMAQYPTIRDWPAFFEDPSSGSITPLAPFVDVDNDEIYNPENGDYPDIRPNPQGSEPDMAIWWVINDKGNIHTESGGGEIGLEIQTLAFAWSTSNAINDMTFYKYKVVNKSQSPLQETFLGQWVDSDIGFPNNDYVGCDTTRGLGYCYNATATDPGAGGYGDRPPTFGLDFFQGPLADENDGVDNDRDGIVDEAGERWAMSKFVYYNNDWSLKGNPEVASHYYGYLSGKWKDGSPIVYNGLDGYSGTAQGPPGDFMFPGQPGNCANGNSGGWSEYSAGIDEGDRRFLISAGPFTLQPNGYQDIIVGAVWARGDDHLSSVCDLLKADDIAQVLFENNFQLLDGPDAPDLLVSEYDRELILNWDYAGSAALRNNVNESYAQSDPVLASLGVPDPVFEFEGYIVYQLKDATVSANDLTNSDLARPIFQCDLKNDISTIVNRTVTRIGTQEVITDEPRVEGANQGIQRSVRIVEDLFAQGNDRRLVNYKTYHFGVIAYAYNDTSSDGKKFIPSNRYFVNVAAMPHKIDFEQFGTVTNSSWGDELQITQISGFGNGGREVAISAETEAEILANNQVSQITYQPGKAPIQVKVVDPKTVQDLEYRLQLTPNRFTGQVDTTRFGGGQFSVDSVFVEWVLEARMDGQFQEIYASEYIKSTHSNGGESFRPEPLVGTERLIEGHGIAISVQNSIASIDSTEGSESPLLGASLTYSDPSQRWLTGLQDMKDPEIFNWLQDGNVANPLQRIARYRGQVYDRLSFFSNVLNGTWGPYALSKPMTNARADIGMSFPLSLTTTGLHNLAKDSLIHLAELPDVDLVFTPDVTKWSRCVVVETAPDQLLGSGAFPLTARWAKSVDQNGNIENNASLSTSNQGMGWFPGFAINVNTGERLNVFFGESSWDIANRGHDMRWNPTGNYGASDNSTGEVPNRVGGRHYVFVTDLPYDSCRSIREELAVGVVTREQAQSSTPTGINGKKYAEKVYGHVAWTGVPMIDPKFEVADPQDIPCETRLSFRCKQGFRPKTGSNIPPVFLFDTHDHYALTGEQGVAEKSLMEQIQVVPNPYYGFSDYEANQLETTVKLTNLPQKCKIRIFTLNGTLIRTYNKENDSPEQRWDLRNESGVPVASGIYIIHIDGFELGEKIVKFFGVLPNPDYTAY